MEMEDYHPALRDDGVGASRGTRFPLAWKLDICHVYMPVRTGIGFRSHIVPEPRRAGFLPGQGAKGSIVPEIGWIVLIHLPARIVLGIVRLAERV